MNEKPLYKKWWVWVIAIFVLSQMFRIFTSTTPSSVTTQSSPAQVSEKFKKMSPAEHLSNAQKSIELKNYNVAKTHLEAIPKESPEFGQVDILKKEVIEKQRRAAFENKLSSDDRSLKEVDNKLNELRTKFKKYYATTDDVRGLKQDVNLLTLTKAAYSTGKSDKERRLYSIVEGLLPRAQLLLREAYASSIEEIFIKSGMDAQVRAVGNNKKSLRITYALMSQPLVYKFQNEIRIDEQATNAGFSQLVYTNGFESSLGKTWTVNLK